LIFFISLSAFPACKEHPLLLKAGCKDKGGLLISKYFCQVIITGSAKHSHSKGYNAENFMEIIPDQQVFD